MRGFVVVLAGTGGNRVLRLISSLLLTRILFPEAFGLMAIISVVMGGLQMFSDIGIRASIVQSKHGADRDFLNTAWTIQIIRGLILSLICLAIAQPLADFYEEPMLAALMPIMAIGPLMSGFASTKIATADRELRQEKLVAITLITQVLGIIVTVALALWTQSVFALAIGGQINTAMFLLGTHFLLPGPSNRLSWNKVYARELISFGKFVFLSTLSSFILGRSDMAILGVYLSIATLGIFNIGYMVGSLPLQVLKPLSHRVVFPLYSRRPPYENESNRKNMRRVRRLVVAGGLFLTAIFAFLGVFLIDLLFDPRYALAGPIVSTVAFAIVPLIVIEGYEAALLSAGDSRRSFYLKGSTAICQLTFLFAGLTFFGLFGAILAPGIAALTTYPLLVKFVKRYDVWDPIADFSYLAAGLALTMFGCYRNWEDFKPLFDLSSL
ncbi:Membrane protein involved in the export of O-antigen and teichoic acid [Cognatiyoonia sediminum]|uniref:Membrane protein involved in the export of O-antigen and teichoic acid n=2 Tax=Cognatiyoonia sediminum TaxID=1508389 RepID=A0A1M5QWH9_9RHOB|nr:Membrane protein involved in the export of O-antigen and teichoic acid [Cognatiyoonia sediminum]